MNKKNMGETCVAFHGHECGGLTIGYQAALYAVRLLELARRAAKRGPAVSLRMSRWYVYRRMMPAALMQSRSSWAAVGKGNLLFHMRGNRRFFLQQKHREVRAPGAEAPPGRNEQGRIFHILSGARAGRAV